MASQSAGSERLNGVIDYTSYSAIFTATRIILYNLTADATQVSIFQTIGNTGSSVPQSFQSFANTDVLYLDTTGVRSLKARDTTGAAYSNDLGAAIDSHIAAWESSVGPTVTANAVSVFEPVDSRYWLAIGSRIYVYSYFPSSKIGGWSYYSPGISITAFAKIKTRLYCLAGNTIYLYGGTTGSVYPAANVTPVAFSTPFLAAGQSAEKDKLWTNVNVEAAGVWNIQYLVNPNDYTAVIQGGTIVNSTYTGPTDNIVGRSPLFALTMTCASAGYASFSGFTSSFLERNV